MPVPGAAALISDRVSGKRFFLNLGSAVPAARPCGRLNLGSGLPNGSGVISSPLRTEWVPMTPPPPRIRSCRGLGPQRSGGVVRTGLGVPPRPPLQGQSRLRTSPQPARVHNRPCEHNVTDMNAVLTAQTGSSERFHGYWGACYSVKAAPQERGVNETGSCAHPVELDPKAQGIKGQNNRLCV